MTDFVALADGAIIPAFGDSTSSRAKASGEGFGFSKAAMMACGWSGVLSSDGAGLIVTVVGAGVACGIIAAVAPAVVIGRVSVPPPVFVPPAGAMVANCVALSVSDRTVA